MNNPPGILDKIDHVLVLMLENRSFDHMLGYLKMKGRADIDGLSGQEANLYQDRLYTVFSLDDSGRQLPFPLATALGPDPDHDYAPTWLQLLGHEPQKDPSLPGGCTPGPDYTITMGGFVQSYATSDQKETVTDPGLVMGYYTQRSVPAFDDLAASFCICNRWFSSAVGSTYANRLFSVSGQSAEATDNPQIEHQAVAGEKQSHGTSALKLRTIFDALSGNQVDWRYYYHNYSLLWLLDAYLTDTRHSWPIQELWDTLDGMSGAAPLPPVTWIDPAFTEEFTTAKPAASIFGNDDHSPTDIRLGQRLVQTLYEKLRASSYWERALLVIVYDEHGGLYDHVSPPRSGDPPPFENYGVRVPALLISPWIQKASVQNEQFDHTSLIRSVLDRFCGGARLADNAANRSDRATSLNVVPATERPRSDCPVRIAADQLPLPEVILQGLGTYGVQSLSVPLRQRASSWGKLVSVVGQRRAEALAKQEAAGQHATPLARIEQDAKHVVSEIESEIKKIVPE